MPALAFTLTVSPILAAPTARSSQSAISTAKADANKKHLRAVPSAARSDVQPKRKEKRARFCHSTPWKQREQSSVAQRLADLLREQRRQFPGFAARIDQFIAQVESDAGRSRSRDRERVIGLLRAWEFGLTVKELMDDTGFSHWDVRQIVADLVKRGIVVERSELRSGTRSRQRVKVYKLK